MRVTVSDPRPIGLFQRRTSDHGALRLGQQILNQLVQGMEPRNPILISQGNSAAHFGHIPMRVEVIAFVKWPTEIFGQELANGGLS
jgi:hypothetical protein